ncbi:hypothetical protein BH11PSE5_BH11PSE5_24850 [soil metagenome]
MGAQRLYVALQARLNSLEPVSTLQSDAADSRPCSKHIIKIRPVGRFGHVSLRCEARKQRQIWLAFRCELKTDPERSRACPSMQKPRRNIVLTGPLIGQFSQIRLDHTRPDFAKSIALGEGFCFIAQSHTVRDSLRGRYGEASPSEQPTESIDLQQMLEGLCAFELSATPVRQTNMSLKSTLFDLFAIGEPIHRRTLSRYSDSDSLSRALGQLVREGRLVRTGRGQFMRPDSHYVPKSAKVLIDVLEQRILQSSQNVFLRKDFRDLGNDPAVGVALRKLVLCGKIVRIGKGLYARASIDPKTGVPMPQVALEKLAVEALCRLGKNVVEPALMPSEPGAVSRSVDHNRIIFIENIVSLRIGYGGVFVPIERFTKASTNNGRD